MFADLIFSRSLNKLFTQNEPLRLTLGVSCGDKRWKIFTSESVKVKQKKLCLVPFFTPFFSSNNRAKKEEKF